MLSTGFGFNRDYSLYPGTGLEGMIDDSIPHDVVTLSNNAASKAQVSKITIGTPASNTNYRLAISSPKLGIDSTTVEFTSSTGATAADIQTGLIGAINSLPRLTGYFQLAKDATDILVTSRIVGTAGEFTLTVSGGGTGFAASSQTAAADPSIIQFGRLLWQQTTDTGRNCRTIDGALTGGVIRGFSVRTEIREALAYPGMPHGYLPTHEVNALTKGRMQIVPVSDMHPTSPIHVYITGENQGRLRAAADGANTVQYTGTGIRIYEPVKALQIGRVEVNLP